MYHAVKYIDSHKVAVTISSLLMNIDHILSNELRYKTIGHLHFICDYIKL